METVLAYASNTVVLCAITCVVSVLFAQKIKDWFAGIDGNTRSALTSLEGVVKSKLDTAKADVLNSIVPVKPPVVPAVAAAPVAPAPVAPAPAPAPHA